MFSHISTRSLKYLVTISTVVIIAISGIAFIPQEENFFTVTGKSVYNLKQYSEQRVHVRVTQDGQFFKTFECDAKGRFETKIYPNHLYMFHFSMDYHATSKVQVDTKLPEDKTQGYVGGLFSFECEMFERVEGLNLSLLNNPLVKIKFNPEKNDFEYDRRYTEKMLYNLEGFREQLAELKQRRKEILKDESEANKSEYISKVEPIEKKRKVIAFESEKEKPKAVNKRGARNIMDMQEEEEDEEVVELRQADSIMEKSKAVVLDESIGQAEITAEDIALEEAIDESEFITLSVIPRRVDVKQAVEEDEQNRKSLDFTKMKTQEDLEILRVEEETKIREELRSFSSLSMEKREKRLVSKKVQNERMRTLIKSVAMAEIYYKKEYYRLHPIEVGTISPSIFKKEDKSWWIDKEYVTVMYPSKSVKFRKETYLFGISYYYMGDKEIDEETYCSSIEQLSKRDYLCAN